MSEIFIHEKDMPKSCFECELNVLEPELDDYASCVFWNLNENTWRKGSGGRVDGCPPKSIKRHGKNVKKQK